MKRTALERRTPLRAKAPMARKREKRQPVQKARRKPQKDQRFRSERYLRFVRGLPCCVCGAPADDAHHVIGLHWGLSGMSTTAPDSYTMPVCRTCHRDVHRLPELQLYQPGWLRHTIALGMREFDGEIHEVLSEALAFINRQEAA
ncbi:DUF968 domain-containing protein [Halomonas caseinilytica]|uniref:DUF968 domain-containing protein n=1 Tax=Halomonas caseinilytica TaxID=438744 RepID=UPI0007E53476|nr:DUF968 domain-containing protein [Halomonas caseinilytica]SEN66015.1 Protein of unknown function [Halomonas caseinilytica]